MSFEEIYNENIYVAPSLSDSVNNHWSIDDLNELLMNGANALVIGEPGSGKSFLSYCIMRSVIDSDCCIVWPIDLQKWTAVSLLNRIDDIDKLQLNTHVLCIVDGLDEFCINDENISACERVIERLSSIGSLLVLCRRYEYDTYISNYLNADYFDKVLRMKNWDFEQHFMKYLYIIEGRESINVKELSNVVRESNQLMELTKRPLHARMLVYVFSHTISPDSKIESIADLYRSYFLALASTVRGFHRNLVLDCWRHVAWIVFTDTRLHNKSINILNINYKDIDNKELERIIAPIINWSEQLYREEFTFLHYSFYEFLVSWYFVENLCQSIDADDIDVCNELLQRDLTLEIRHYTVMLLSSKYHRSQLNNLMQLYQFDNECVSDPIYIERRRVSDNLLLYFIGRVTNVSYEQLYRTLETEHDDFIRTSIFWCMCNLNYVEGLRTYLYELRRPLYASLNRGYLLYYYGDIRFNERPPYCDDETKTWDKTRLRNIEMFMNDNYINVCFSRILLDIYTFIDFCTFHKSQLEDNVLDLVLRILKSQSIFNDIEQECYDIVLKKINQYLSIYPVVISEHHQTTP